MSFVGTIDVAVVIRPSVCLFVCLCVCFVDAIKYVQVLVLVLIVMILARIRSIRERETKPGPFFGQKGIWGGKKNGKNPY